MNRRLFLQWSGVGALSSVAPAVHATSTADSGIELTAKPGKAQLVRPDFPATDVWGFNGQVPGTPIRISRGQSVNAKVQNELEVPTAVHWHGIRLPNAMDGVAGLTQPAIQHGESFHYQFTPPDSGTYWYHSHVNACLLYTSPSPRDS